MDGPRVVLIGGVAVERRTGGLSGWAERGEQRGETEDEAGGVEFHGEGKGEGKGKDQGPRAKDQRSKDEMGWEGIQAGQKGVANCN